MLSIFEIRPGKDYLLGQAADKLTAMSLLKLALHNGATGISLHGELPGTCDLSGECSLRDAVEWVDTAPDGNHVRV